MSEKEKIKCTQCGKETEEATVIQSKNLILCKDCLRTYQLKLSYN